MEIKTFSEKIAADEICCRERMLPLELFSTKPFLNTGSIQCWEDMARYKRYGSVHAAYLQRLTTLRKVGRSMVVLDWYLTDLTYEGAGAGTPPTSVETLS